LQDCAKDLAELDRCYLPDALLTKHGVSVADLQGEQETHGLRAVFATLLDHVDQLQQAACALPRHTQDRRLRLETAVIVQLSQRLAARLRRGDPLATRVKLSRGDVVASLTSAIRYLF
jgi:phytoene/squalene synthetase